MRKILFGVLGCLVAVCAHAAQIVNVDYIHKLIAQEWDISIPIKADSPMHVANMKYLLTAVDVANEILNGEKTTDYGNGEFATLQVADTVATIQAVDTLVRKEIEYKFFLTTTPTNSFSFSISAAGEFIVNWGDGTLETITKPDTTNTTYSHTYSTSKSYTIKLTGQATAYNTGTSTATISFYVNSSQTKIASIDGSLGAIFGTLSSGTNKQPRFYQTFFNATNMTGSIPSDLFAGISGKPASYMFQSTFSGCSGLTGAIPAGLFAGISGAPAGNMFAYTFYGCSGLTGAIPDGLFAGISGAPASYMFRETFYGCSGLTSIPENLFAGISGAPAIYMFHSTFYGCSGLTSIPENLFAGISGAPASFMFYRTFYGCSGLTSIPENLFAGISGKPAKYMFSSTFSGCSGLTSIPSDLFAGISGAPASSMFAYTFYGCSGLTSIPENLFAGISGAPASDMFSYTFNNCRGLTGAIPAGLFGNLTGAPASNMFQHTFSGCSGLTSIPENLFGNISGTAQSNMFYRTFYNCTSLTGPSARINGQHLYEIWPDATSSQVGSMYYNATKLDDYRCIPTAWGGGGEDCSAPTAEFTLTTTDDTDSFSFNISAAGEFVIDWGDGTVETITKPDTTNTTYSHNYDTAGAYSIGLGGQATAYNTDEYTAAIRFVDTVDWEFDSTGQIASIDGSLGAIFGTLSSDTNNQPRFYQTFYGAYNMEGSIPDNLFAGISGAPASYMFLDTFSDCSGLTSIPAGLFAGISGEPASSMFNGTFYGCERLTSIPAGLFAGISGAPADSMFNSTFWNCDNLTSIPENLFGNISGPAQNSMFSATFDNCTSLTGPSARINGQYLYEIWPDANSNQVDRMYQNATGLSDYLYIPTSWGGLGATTNEYPSAPSDAVYDFYLTTTSDTDVFAMRISAAGEFYIDWGDGKTEWITKSDTTNMTFGHKYASKGVYNIRLGGQATAYNTSTTTAAISFDVNLSEKNIASIDGSLGAIFGTLGSDTNNQPRFYWTFSGASNMTGSIPENLFVGISGAPASYMFESTFSGCSKLTAIPDGLFAGISGAPAVAMFNSTFSRCSGLTSIPENLFGNISGTAKTSMFHQTFYNCKSLTGPSARINGQYLYEIWPSATTSQVNDMYYNATKLSDYASIPSAWK